MSADASPDAALEAALARLAPRLVSGATGISGLRRLSGGASQETWAFRTEGAERALILRRAPAADRPGKLGGGLALEAAVIRRAEAAGVPVPEILHETLPSRIFRDPAFAPAREGFARQAGRILAAIHRVDPEGPPLETVTPASAVAELAARHAEFGQPRPVFSLALRWLEDNAPDAPVTPRLVHGDFRMGNLMLGPEGVRAVLDWELVHVGDPRADLAWVCMRSWRFGRAAPVGGMGDRDTLFAAYEAAGGEPVDPAAVRWWEVLSALRWGVIIEEMGAWVRTGADRSVERHVIARRASETEWTLVEDLLGEAV
jgi:aminoglycoside phosphotransferase (APT) family kinase protein